MTGIPQKRTTLLTRLDIRITGTPYIQHKMVIVFPITKKIYNFHLFFIRFDSLFLGLSPFETTSDDQEVALVGGLHPAVTYTFRIFAINSIDVSVPTDPVVAKTQEEGTKTHKYFKYIYFYLTIFLFLLSFFFTFNSTY